MTGMQSVRDGYMSDARGRLVPMALVKPEHLLEDELVRALHAEAVMLSEQLRHFREQSVASILTLLDLLGEKYGAKPGGQHGNLTLNTYDGSLRVQISVNDQLELGPELQAAKDLIDACIHRWSAGVPDELKALVLSAFDVDKKGKLNVDRILALRRLEIQDPEWQQAMVAINDSARIVSTKQYLRLYARKGDEQKHTQVPLDLASV